MKIQVLIASMNQTDHCLLNKMNIQSDAIVGNQCDRNSVDEFIFNGHSIKYLNFAERGVGLNRNNALMRASADICLFADDDMRYFDGYEDIVIKAFVDNPKADVIIFNLKEKKPTRYINRNIRRVNCLNFLRYGAARIAIKTNSVRLEGIFFNQCFGGGTEHSAGEDNLFLSSCLKKGLKVYTSPCFIAELLEDRESSWFKGYNEKYFFDLGVLFRLISGRFWPLLCVISAVKRRKEFKVGIFSSLRIMIKGAKSKS